MTDAAQDGNLLSARLQNYNLSLQLWFDEPKLFELAHLLHLASGDAGALERDNASLRVALEAALLERNMFHDRLTAVLPAPPEAAP